MGWLSFLDFIVEPTFIDRSHPPLNIKVSAKLMGWIALVLFALLTLALLFGGVLSVFQIRSHPTHFATALVGFVLILITQVVALVGAWQMTQGNHNGRRLLLQGPQRGRLDYLQHRSIQRGPVNRPARVQGRALFLRSDQPFS